MAHGPVSIHRIDPFITHSQESIFGLPRSEPVRLTILYGLADARSRRFMLSSQKEDLDKAIFHYTESMLFPPRSWLDNGLSILGAFFQLATMLVKRSIVFKLPKDAIYASTYLRHLRDQPHQTFGFTRYQVTGVLVDALAFQVESKAGDVMEILGEMADLCRELLTRDMSNFIAARCFVLFIIALLSELGHEVPDQPIDQFDQFIECLRVAGEHPQFLSESRATLALCLTGRYCMTFLDDDYEEAALILDEIITSSSSGDAYVGKAQQAVTALALARSSSHQTPEYTEEAMYHRVRSVLGSSSVEQSLFPIVFSLEAAARLRALCFRVTKPEGPERFLKRNPAFTQGTWGKFFEQISSADPESGRMFKNMELLQEIYFGLINDTAEVEIDEAVKKHQGNPPLLISAN